MCPLAPLATSVALAALAGDPGETDPGKGGPDLGLDSGLYTFEAPGSTDDGTGGRVASRAAEGEPRVFFLFYPDGGPAPPGACKGTPPAFACGYGSYDGVLGCKKKVQAYMDKWYADFNIIFTLTKPSSGKYYTEVASHDASWCPAAPAGAGGFAPSSCTDQNGGTAYTFVCGGNAYICAMVLAQEQGHLCGLEHTTSTKDVMYPTKCSCQGFEDRDNPTTGDACSRPTQNSYRMMKDRLGAWPAGMEKPSPYPASPDGGAGSGGGGAGGGAAGGGGDGGSGGVAGQGGAGGAGDGQGGGGGSGERNAAGGCSLSIVSGGDDGSATVRALVLGVVPAFARRRSREAGPPPVPR